MKRIWSLCVLVSLLGVLAVSAAAQRTPPGAESSMLVTLTVRVAVVGDSGGQLRPLRLQLINSMGATVVDRFIMHSLVDLPQVERGTYHIVISGDGVQETRSEAFVIRGDEIRMQQTVMVTRATPEGGEPPPSGPVPAAELAVPDKARRELERGIKALAQDRLPVARQHLQRALQHYPEYGAAYNNLGVIAMREGDRQQARKHFERAVELAPQLADGFFNLARLLFRDQEYARAGELLGRAAELDPQNTAALLLLVNAQYLAGRHDEALQAADRMHAAGQAGHAEAHLLAAAIQQQRGALAEAAAEYRAYLAEDPQGSGAPEAAERLRGLEQRLQSKVQP